MSYATAGVKAPQGLLTTQMGLSIFKSFKLTISACRARPFLTKAIIDYNSSMVVCFLAFSQRLSEKLG